MSQPTEEANNPTTSAERLIELSSHPHLRPLVAGNPAAPADLLTRLAQDRNPHVRQAVAGNPNTPWPTLERLAPKFPHEFLHNPIGPLQVVTHPEQISIDGNLWDALLENAAIPPLWWDWLRSHPAAEVSQTVRLHVQYAGDAAHPYGAPGQEEAGDLLALVELLSAARAQGMSLPALANNTLAAELEVSGEQFLAAHLRWLARNEEHWVRDAVASNEQTPTEVLRTMAQDQDWFVRSNIAANPQTPIEVLQTMAHDEHKSVRRTLAWNPQTPVEVLYILAQDQDWEVRESVATAWHPPVEILRMLAQQDDADGVAVRLALTYNPQLPIEVLWNLAQNDDAMLRTRAREAIVQNKRIPMEILSALANDEEVKIREVVAQNEQTPTKVLQRLALDQAVKVRQTLASNPHFPAEGLPSLALDQSWEVRQAVARNEHTPTEVLQTMALDQEWGVREAVARNKQTPTEVLQILAHDIISEVQQAVVSNEQLPIELLQTMAHDQDEVVRMTVASCKRTPTEVLRMLARDEDRWVRGAVSENEQTPVTVLQMLTQDEDTAVRWWAKLAQDLLVEGPIHWQKWRKTINLSELNPFEEYGGLNPNHNQGDDQVVKRLLDQVIKADASEYARQTVIAALVTAWDFTKILAAFRVSEITFDANHHHDSGREHSRRIMTPFMPPIALQKLAASSRWEVRYLAALHAQTPGEIRQVLSQDDNRYVRAMARMTRKPSSPPLL